MQLHNYVIENLWVESEDYETDKVLNIIIHSAEIGNRIDKYLYVKHDKDKLLNGDIVKSHYYILIHCKSQILDTTLAKQLNIPVAYLSQIKGTMQDAICYSIHLNNPDKYQYKENEIFTNDIDWLQNNLQKRVKLNLDEMNAIFYELCDWCINLDHNVTWYELIQYSRHLGQDYEHVMQQKHYNIQLHWIIEERQYTAKRKKF